VKGGVYRENRAVPHGIQGLADKKKGNDNPTKKIRKAKASTQGPQAEVAHINQSGKRGEEGRNSENQHAWSVEENHKERGEIDGRLRFTREAIEKKKTHLPVHLPMY